MKLRVNGTTVRVDPRRSIGKGGEADVYDIGGGKALKVFKLPDHPDYAGIPEAERAAEERIDEHQRKLPAFPRNTPPRVIAPESLATAGGGRIVGYTMRFLTGGELLLRYGDRSFRDAGVSFQTVVAILRNLHDTVLATHRAGLVIGDFNDLNILVAGTEAYLIDADSFQFGPFRCRMFTSRFLDPLLCDATTGALVPARPHSELSDWYAFTIMVMQCLLFVGPYGGVYKPQDPARRMAPEARPLARLTVFHPDVKYPKPALPYGLLPDDLLEHFHRVFEKDERGPFPAALLERLAWTRCTRCQTEHARAHCPACFTATAASVKASTRVRGNVKATRVFKTSGAILAAAVEGGSLLYLSHEAGAFKREDGGVLFEGALDPRMKFRVEKNRTHVGRGGEVVTFTAAKPPVKSAVDTYRQVPAFEVSPNARFWISNGQLQKGGMLGPEVWGNVLEGQTLFWVGQEFGLGFYRAGDLSVAFVFDVERRGLNDRLKLPLSGQLVAARCFFGSRRAWLLTATQEGADLIHRAFVVSPRGDVEATAQAKLGDGSWLSVLNGKCAAGPFLLAATDDGLVRVEPDGGRIAVTREFPDTEPFVTTASEILASPDGIYVVDRNEIRLLSIQ